MKQISCDIIRDLVPSYLDGICSEASRDAVKEHLLGCEKCRSYLDSLKSTEIVDGKSGQAELSFMHKIRDYYTRKNTLGASLLFFLVIMVLLFVPHNAFTSVSNTLTFYTVLFTVLVLGTISLLGSYHTGPKRSPVRIAAGIASAIGIVYCTVIAAISYRALSADEQTPAGDDLSRLGPSLNLQLILVLLLELLLFAFFTVDAVRKKHHPGILPALNLAGCILCMNYRCLLFMMSSPDVLRLLLIRATVLAAVPAVATVAIVLIVTKCRKQDGLP